MQLHISKHFNRDFEHDGYSAVLYCNEGMPQKGTAPFTRGVIGSTEPLSWEHLRFDTPQECLDWAKTGHADKFEGLTPATEALLFEVPLTKSMSERERE